MILIVVYLLLGKQLFNLRPVNPEQSISEDTQPLQMKNEDDDQANQIKDEWHLPYYKIRDQIYKDNG